MHLSLPFLRVVSLFLRLVNRRVKKRLSLSRFHRLKTGSMMKKRRNELTSCLHLSIQRRRKADEGRDADRDMERERRTQRIEGKDKLKRTDNNKYLLPLLVSSSFSLLPSSFSVLSSFFHHAHFLKVLTQRKIEAYLERLKERKQRILTRENRLESTLDEKELPSQEAEERRRQEARAS